MASLPDIVSPTEPRPADAVRHKIFLDLPAELRNVIYEYVIEGSPLHLTRLQTSDKIVNPSPMLYVNKQVSSDYDSLALTTANIETRAYDFNFNHITAYLEQLSDKETANLTGEGGKLRRQTRRIEVFPVPLRPNAARDWLCIGRWVRAVQCPFEGGVEFDFQYVWKFVSGPDKSWFGTKEKHLEEVALMPPNKWASEESYEIRAAMEIGWQEYLG